MPLTIDSNTIEEVTGLSSRAAEKAAKYAPDAERSLRGLLTDQVYNEKAAQPEQDPDHVALVRALCFLAIYHSLPVLNMRPADRGGLLKIVGHGDYSEELMSHSQLSAVRASLWDMAVDMVGHLMPEGDDESMLTGRGFGMTAVPKSERRDYTHREGWT